MCADKSRFLYPELSYALNFGLTRYMNVFNVSNSTVAGSENFSYIFQANIFFRSESMFL